MQASDIETTCPAVPAPEPWHALSPHDVQRAFVTDPEHGLTASEAASRLAKYGGNTLGEAPEEPWWQEAAESLTEPLQLLLIAVAALYFWFGETDDALTIVAVISAVVAIEVFTELRATRAVAALSSLSAPGTTVLRDGQPLEVKSSEVVPGDVVLLAAGHRVPADVRLVESLVLRVDESALTGESVPVTKKAGAEVAPDAELADRVTMAYAGTLVTSGKGRGLVVATARASELGRIAGLVRSAREPRTPLQISLGELSKWLLWVAVAFSIGIPLLGVVLAGAPVKDMVLVGLTLAFATIPEELPILITVVLGLGAYRLSQRQAIVRRLRAAETLGSVSVVATDKTGTLTENRMRLVEVFADGQSIDAADATTSLAAQKVLVVGLLANDAQVTRAGAGIEFVGDPTETALLAGAQAAGLDVERARASQTVLDEFPFSSDRNRTSILLARSGGALLAAKVSPESVLSACSSVRRATHAGALTDSIRQTVLARADAMAARGLRVLAMAERSLPAIAATGIAQAEAERDLTFLGLVGLQDPPRAGAREAVRALRAAGVRVLMVTGDHPATAAAIADQVGMDASAPIVRGSELAKADEAALADLVRRTTVFARIAPEHKLRVVRALQADGEVVAVTGDGVNDAPALKEAAVGVAMGRGGTDVARECADLILADDNFATVTEAVRSARVLFGNLRKAVRYYLAAKVALVTASLAAALLKLPVPFDPVQIIVMELFMDLGASVTFVSEPAEDDVMRRPPRDPRSPFMDRSMRWGIVLGGLSLGGAVLVAYLGAQRMGADLVQAQTAAFAAWMIGHVVLAAHMRAERQPLLATSRLSNPAWVLWAVAAIGLAVIATTVPAVSRQLHMTALTPQMWWLVVVAAVLLPAWWEPYKWMRWRVRGSWMARQKDFPG